MREHTITLATRQSVLAQTQTRLVADALTQKLGWTVTTVGVVSRGDEITDKPLAEVGGKELFIKALQKKILSGEADAAVHSLKDMSALADDGFVIAAVLPAADAADVLVSSAGLPLTQLPAGATVGAAGPRRAALLRHYYPQLQPVCIRGNIHTRLEKLQRGDCDALILAAAGLKRVGLESVITEVLPTAQFVPAVGQGIIAVECRANNTALIKSLQAINDEATMVRAVAERAFAAAMNGDCATPLGALATLQNQKNADGDDGLKIHCIYVCPQGNFYESEVTAQSLSLAAAKTAGETAAQKILAQLAAH